jgi:hypothetical protein
MPYHSTAKKMDNKKMNMKTMSDMDYYKEHKKHHSDKHIKAMKELQKMGVDREKAHKFVQKYMGK